MEVVHLLTMSGNKQLQSKEIISASGTKRTLTCASVRFMPKRTLTLYPIESYFSDSASLTTHNSLSDSGFFSGFRLMVVATGLSSSVSVPCSVTR